MCHIRVYNIFRMHTSFWFGVNIKDFLFYGYNIQSVLTLLATCFGLLVFGVIMEWLGLVQAKIRHNELVERQQQLRRICPTESDSLIANDQEPGTSNQRTQFYRRRKTKL